MKKTLDQYRLSSFLLIIVFVLPGTIRVDPQTDEIKHPGKVVMNLNVTTSFISVLDPAICYATICGKFTA